MIKAVTPNASVSQAPQVCCVQRRGAGSQAASGRAREALPSGDSAERAQGSQA